MRWFRMHVDAIDDDKLRLLAFEDRWHFVALCCLKADGLLDSDSDNRDRRIAVKMGVQVRELEEIKRRLMEAELIDENMHPVAWEKRQYKHDNSTERVRAYRERQRQQGAEQPEEDETPDETVTKHDVTVSETPPDTDTDTDTEKNKDLSVSSKAKPPTPHQQIVELYHEQLPDLSRVVKLTDERRRRLRKLHEGIMERDLDNWRGYWQAVRRSDFLMGRKKDWRADFDFLTRPNTPLKVLEGSYQ